MPSVKTVNKAITILDNMKLIVKKDQLLQGTYCDFEIDEKLAKRNAPCGGHKACAYGSLWLASGAKFDPKTEHGLPMILEHERAKYTRNRPGLKLAEKALNAVAVGRIAGSWARVRAYRDPLEQYFEKVLYDEEPAVIRKEMLSLINTAQRNLRKQLQKVEA